MSGHEHQGEYDPHWLKQLVHKIKEVDHDAAVEQKEKDRKAEVLKTKGPIVWRAFGDFLNKFVDEMNAEFGDDVTAVKITFNKGQQGSESYRINKAAFPTVAFNAAPNFQGNENNLSFFTENPQHFGQVTNMQSIPCRFEVVGAEVELQLNGHLYNNPEDAARFIIEKLFTL